MAKYIGARVYNSGNIVVSDVTWKWLPFDSERYDTDAIHSTSSNTSRLTCQTAGKYIIGGGFKWAENPSGIRYAAVKLNGSTYIVADADQAVVEVQGMCINTIYELSVSDYVELGAWQNSVGDLNVEATTNYTDFWMHKLGDIGARVYNSGDISIPNNTSTELTFDSERYDTDAIHSTLSNTSRLTCQKAGRYFIGGGIRFPENVTGFREVYIKINGSDYIASNKIDSFGNTAFFMCVNTVYKLDKDDYVELGVWQDSGGALDCIVAVNTSPEFWMSRL